MKSIAAFCDPFYIVVDDRDNDSHKSRIGPVVTERVGDNIKLGLVLAGNHTIPGLIPVQDQTLLVTLADHITVQPRSGRLAREWSLRRHRKRREPIRCREDSS